MINFSLFPPFSFFSFSLCVQLHHRRDEENRWRWVSEPIERKKVGGKLIFFNGKLFSFSPLPPRNWASSSKGIQAHFPTHNFITLVVPPHRNSPPSFEPNHLSLPSEKLSKVSFSLIFLAVGDIRDVEGWMVGIFIDLMGHSRLKIILNLEKPLQKNVKFWIEIKRFNSLLKEIN